MPLSIEIAVQNSADSIKTSALDRQSESANISGNKRKRTEKRQR
jgi:hypothetical protein